MINYYFFQFIKKKIWTGPDRPVGVRPPGGQRWDGFDFFEFGPPWTGPFGLCGTVDRGPSGFGPDRPGPDRLQYSSYIAL
jgi:hypothetical protein